MEYYKIPKIHKENSDITVETNNIFSYHTHMHSYYEMTLYDAFSGTIAVNDNAFTINTPTAVLIVPSDFHRTEVINSSNARYIKIAFDSELIENELTLDYSIILSGIEKSDFLYRLFNEINETEKQSLYTKKLVQAAVYALAEKGVRINTSPNAVGSELAKKVIRIINEKFSEEITLSSVAKELSVSPQYLSTVFKKNIGVNFSKYLNTVRLKRASKLLEDTKESVTHICEMCGYRNFSHFLRSFKAMFGCSPNIYRKNKFML